MLIIGHRGAAGLAPENTIESLRIGYEAGADMLEFDIRLTKDGKPVLMHDKSLKRTHGTVTIVESLTLKELQKKTKDNKTVASLKEVLDEFFGNIMLNIELKGDGTGEVVAKLLRDRYVKDEEDWSNVFLSSFKPKELRSARKISADVPLAVLTNRNPFTYLAYSRSLDISAVGFNRSNMHHFATEIAKKAGLFTYVYTVNRPQSVVVHARQGIDAVVTDFPDKILKTYNKKFPKND